MSTPEPFSCFVYFKHITAWIRRFVNNCHRKNEDRPTSLYLSTSELMSSETYWPSFIEQQAYVTEIEALKCKDALPKSSRLFTLHPFLDSSNLLRVGHRSQNAQMSYPLIHPIILPNKNPITSLISSQHRRLMHAGPTLLVASLVVTTSNALLQILYSIELEWTTLDPSH